MKLQSLTDSKNTEDFYILSKINHIFKRKRGDIFYMPQKKEPVILLLSGGLDSICLWNYLMSRYGLNVYPLHCSNLNKQSLGVNKSLTIFSKIFKKTYPDLFHEVFFINNQSLFSFKNVKNKKNILYDLSLIIPNLIYDTKQKKQYVGLTSRPAGLGYLTFAGFEYVHKLRYEKGLPVKTLFIGIVPEDRPTRTSSPALLRSLNLTLCLMSGSFQWQFISPFELNLSKKGLVKWALKKNLPLDIAWSCVKSEKIHCGECPNCELRKEAFKKAGFLDKTDYQNSKKPFYKFKKKALFQLVTAFFMSMRKKGEPVNYDQLRSESLIFIPGNIIWEKVSNDICLLNKKNTCIEILNDSASYLWQVIAKSQPIKLILLQNLFEKNYGLDKKQAESDLFKFLQEMVKNNYLQTK